ncbi:MAG: HEAT repeat domain-containing protein [Candidatus Bathyarchaeota archaeon]|nr:HEAT repeat domain-containing protein [Candidatus Bathyarchaeota archaeon]
MQANGDIDGLINALEYKKDPSVRIEASRALFMIRDRRTINALIAALNDPVVEVRQNASATLRDLVDDRAENSMHLALKDTDYWVRQNAAYMLSRTNGEHKIDGLLYLLADRKWRSRPEAAKELGELHNERAVEGLVAVLNESDDDLNHSSIEALGKIGGDKALNTLIAALHDPKASTRKDAAKALGIIGDRRAVESLIVTLKDENNAVKLQAIDTLNKIGDIKAIEPLADILKDATVCKPAAEALVKIGREKALNALILTLQNQDVNSRRCAIEALGSIHNLQATNALVPLLKDESIEIRRLAATSLGEIGDSQATDALVAVFRMDNDFSVRRAASRALGQLNSPSFSISPEEVDQKLKSIFDPANFNYTHKLNLNKFEESKLSSELEALKKELDLLVPLSSLTDTVVYWTIYASTFEAEEVTNIGGWETTNLTLMQSNEAISNLCNYVSPVTSNILHLISQKKDISIYYSEGCPEIETNYVTKELSFQNQREQALNELKKRSNPPYDIQNYKKS